MVQGFEEAQVAVQRHLAKDVDWFTPPGQRHFDPASVVFTFAGIMVTAFLAGFVEEAQKSAKEAGRRVYRRLEELVKDVFTGEEDPNMDDLNVIAEQAPAIAKATHEENVLLYVKSVEDDLRIYLESHLPADKAASLAKVVRDSVGKQLIRGA